MYKTWYTPPLTFQDSLTLPLTLSLLIITLLISSYSIVKMPRSLSTGKIVRPKALAVSPTMEEGENHGPVDREELFASKSDPPSHC